MSELRARGGCSRNDGGVSCDGRVEGQRKGPHLADSCVIVRSYSWKQPLGQQKVPRDRITPSTYVSLYVIDDRVALVFGELSTGPFLGPFFLWGPVVRTEKEATWKPFETGNKIIGPV